MGNTMRVVFLEPDREAYVGEIGTDLKDMQEAVGGYIEPIYAFESDSMCIIGNEEAKLVPDWKVSRALKMPDGQVYDTIAGKAFVCAIDGEEFVGLSDEQVECAIRQYKYPEYLIATQDGYTAISYREGNPPTIIFCTPETEFEIEPEMGMDFE